MSRASRRSHARFHFVTDLAKKLTVLSKTCLQTLATCLHVNTLSSLTSLPQSPCLLVFFLVIVFLTRCGSLVKLVNSLLHQFATAFNTLFSVIFHVVAPCCDVFGMFLLAEYIQDNADQAAMLGLPNRLYLAMWPTSSAYTTFSCHLCVVNNTLTTITAFCDESINSPHLETFSHQIFAN